MHTQTQYTEIGGLFQPQPLVLTTSSPQGKHYAEDPHQGGKATCAMAGKSQKMPQNPQCQAHALLGGKLHVKRIIEFLNPGVAHRSIWATPPPK